MPFDGTPDIDTTVRTVLLDAAEIVRVGGHCKGRLHDDQDRHCIVGAVVTALGARTSGDGARVGKFGAHGPLFRRAIRAIERLLPNDVRQSTISPGLDVGRNCVRWNNAPERTCYEVIEILEAAAKS